MQLAIFSIEIPAGWLQTMNKLTTTQALLEKKMENQALLDRQRFSSKTPSTNLHSYPSFSSSEWIWAPNIVSKELETLQRFNDLEHLLEQETEAHGILVSQISHV